jgi:hypothetical protein
MHRDPDIIVSPDEGKRVRFYFHDGSFITVHVVGGKLRACGSEPLESCHHRTDVINVDFRANCFGNDSEEW